MGAEPSGAAADRDGGAIGRVRRKKINSEKHLFRAEEIQWSGLERDRALCVAKGGMKRPATGRAKAAGRHSTPKSNQKKHRMGAASFWWGQRHPKQFLKKASLFSRQRECDPGAHAGQIRRQDSADPEGRKMKSAMAAPRVMVSRKTSRTFPALHGGLGSDTY